jgi:hypothetical protein
MDNYFNLIGTGPDPFTTGVGTTSGVMVTTKCSMGYVAPYNGEVVSVNVNSAYVANTSLDNAGFDFIIVPSVGTPYEGLTVWTTLYTSPNHMSGFSQSFSLNTFNKGDLILCYVGDYSGGGGSNFSGIPIAPTDGEFNVTLYVKYTP